MKELQIVAPEGYEVDKQNSTFEKIVFKKKSSKPTSWAEFCRENPRVVNEYYINSMGKIENFNSQHSSLIASRRVEEDKNLCKTEAEAEAFLALIQLRRLWHEWRDGKPCQQDIPVIFSFKHQIDGDWGITYFQYNMAFPIWFYSEETAKLFLETFKDLFDKVKVLYQ